MSRASANDNKQIRVLLSGLVMEFANLNRHIVEAYSLMEYSDDKKERLKSIIKEIEASDLAVREYLKRIKALLNK